jgi:hypothetical protein
MSRHTANGVVPSNEADALGQIYRRLGALHATLAEADRVDEGLQRRTLDRLMDLLELIEEVPEIARVARAAKALESRPVLGEHDLAALRVDLPAHGLITGDVGTVVFVHTDGASYEVEFVTGDGQTLAVETLTVSQVEPVSGAHILHMRRLASA